LKEEEDGPHAELCSVIRGNVVAQLINLKAQPSVSRAIQERRLQVFGWYYDILSGRIEQFNEEERGFAPLLGRP
jgi:carbonic anhydrase